MAAVGASRPSHEAGETFAGALLEDIEPDTVRKYRLLEKTAPRPVRRESGIKDFHPHRCRHTYAMRWLASGGSLSALQDLLGHADSSTTTRYAKVTHQSRGLRV